MRREIRKIMLIQPPRLMYGKDEHKRSAPPIGIAYLAAVIEDSYEVKILDATAEGFWQSNDVGGGLLTYGLDYKEIEERVRQFGPDVVGISSIFTSQHPNATKVATLVKSVDKDIITVVGGDHPTALTREVLAEGVYDFVVIGEGEYTFRDLLKALESGGGYDGIDGLAYRDGDRVVVNPKTSYIKDLDELPFPAWRLLPMELYQKINSPHSEPIPLDRLPYTPMVSSRGCPAACTFCSSAMMWGRHNLRIRSAENVLEEMELLVNRGYKEIYFDDDNFIYDNRRAHKILDAMIENKWDITWSMPNGVALYSLNRPLLEKMKRSGCHTLCLPIESGSQRVLSHIIHKPLSLKKVPDLIRDMKDIGFFTMGFFMIGFPGETKEEIEQTISFAFEMKKIGMDYASFFNVIPLPGTEIYKTCMEYDYIDDMVLTKMITGKGMIKTPEFDPEYLGRVRHKAWAMLNFAGNTDFLLYPEEAGAIRDKMDSLNVGKDARLLVMGDFAEVVRSLSDTGDTLTAVTSEGQLVDILSGDKPDALLIDTGMEGFDAWGFMKRLRKDERLRGLPTVLIIKDGKDALKGRDITWLITEVLDKKESYA